MVYYDLQDVFHGLPWFKRRIGWFIMIYKMYFMGYHGFREGRKGYHDLQDVFHGLPWFKRRKEGLS